MTENISTAMNAGQTNGSRLRLLATLLVLLILQLPLAGMLAPGLTVTAQIERETIFWACTVLLVGYILLFERRGLSSIGLYWPNWKSLLFGFAGAIVMMAGIAFIYLVIFPEFGWSDQSQTAEAENFPFGLLFVVVVRAAVFEEIFYRGFAIERLTEITGLRWLAGLISVIAFTYAHLDYWGWAHLLVAGFGGLVLTGMYLWRRDLASNMIAHFLTDAVGFLLEAV
ncbi:CPBP family intramembrane glutamic endopeptidase [Pseudolysobacter antarcticus]|nr:type II CAAX endopeptidase family protein [Pseudolysobacter antarcticus]